MRKVAIVAACLLLGAYSAQAQLDLLKKAAKKTAAKVTEKVTDKVADKASEAVDKELDKYDGKSTSKKAAEQDDATIKGIMMQLPELPTAQQLVTFKDAELNEKSLKMLASPVSSFRTHVMALSLQAMNLSVGNMDSAQVSEMAYRYAELSTGMSREEIDKMATMNEEEQQAYLAEHYRQGTYEENMVKEAEAAGQYLKPLEPLIDQWDAAGKKADALIEEATAKCREVYAKYADRLGTAGDKERNKLLMQCYAETVNMQREAVQKALKVRMDEQLPIAEQIEGKMVAIRAAHKDMVSALLNYPQLTATAYFAEVEFLFEIVK